jgi:hypothetical protein
MITKLEISSTDYLDRAESPVEGADPRWKSLYIVGGIACVASVIIIVLGFAAYFIWPYAPGRITMAKIFETIQNDWLGGLVALDFFLLLGNLVSILVFVALYAALRQVNQSYALIALVLGLIGLAVIVPARPIAEMFSLSNLYATAANEAEKSRYLAAGEALLATFNGTGWIVNTFLGTLSLLTSAVLMLRGNVFSKATAYVGIVTNGVTLGFFLPGIGIFLLFLSLPFMVVWDLQLARRFFQLGRLESKARPQ